MSETQKCHQSLKNKRGKRGKERKQHTHKQQNKNREELWEINLQQAITVTPGRADPTRATSTQHITAWQFTHKPLLPQTLHLGRNQNAVFQNGKIASRSPKYNTVNRDFTCLHSSAFPIQREFTSYWFLMILYVGSFHYKGECLQ